MSAANSQSGQAQSITCLFIAFQVNVKSKLYYDRWSFGQSLVVSDTHLGPMIRFLLLSDCCRFVDVGALSLAREWVCSLQCVLVLASAVILGSESRGTHNHSLLIYMRDSPNLWGQVPVFIIPPRAGWPTYIPRH
jgi:hypothetical protein